MTVYERVKYERGEGFPATFKASTCVFNLGQRYYDNIITLIDKPTDLASKQQHK